MKPASARKNSMKDDVMTLVVMKPASARNEDARHVLLFQAMQEESARSKFPL